MHFYAFFNHFYGTLLSLYPSWADHTKFDFVSLLIALRSLSQGAPSLPKWRFAQERGAIERFQRAMCPALLFSVETIVIFARITYNYMTCWPAFFLSSRCCNFTINLCQCFQLRGFFNSELGFYPAFLQSPRNTQTYSKIIPSLGIWNIIRRYTWENVCFILAFC